jgi:hypothetical protein
MEVAVWYLAHSADAEEVEQCVVDLAGSSETEVAQCMIGLAYCAVAGVARVV